MNASHRHPLFEPETLADPYRVYARLREQDPVYWHEPLSAWVLTRYDDVDAVLRDRRFSSTIEHGTASGTAPEDTLRQLYAFVDGSLVFSDPPAHTRLRGLVSRAFTPRSVEALRPRIEELADGYLDEMAGADPMDVVHDLAYPLPLAVVSDLLGFSLDATGRAELKGWCDDFLIPFGRDLATLTGEERSRAASAATSLRGFVDELVAQVRSRPGDDVLSGLVHAAEDGARLSEDELFATVILFLIAGHENLTSLIACGTVALLENPDQLELLRREPERWLDAVTELNRYVTPNQFIRRQATESLELDGTTVDAGKTVLLILAAANRDPSRYADPDRLDVTRPVERNLALGHGFHYCLGAPLAHLETEIVFPRLFERFPALRLTGEPLDYEPNFNARILRSLPVASV